MAPKEKTVPSSRRSNSPPAATLSAHKKKKTTLGQKAGLQFNVSKFLNKLKKGRYAKIIRKGAAVYMASAIEYVCAEILELSGDIAKNNRRVRITPRYIMLAIKTDDELNRLLSNVDMPGVGTTPYINPVLLPKPTARRRSSNKPKSSQMDVDVDSTLVEPSNTESY